MRFTVSSASERTHAGSESREKEARLFPAMLDSRLLAFPQDEYPVRGGGAAENRTTNCWTVRLSLCCPHTEYYLPGVDNQQCRVIVYGG